MTSPDEIEVALRHAVMRLNNAAASALLRRLADQIDPPATAESDQLRAKLKDYEQLFDLQWSRSQQAIALWRAESPAERANVLPDMGRLLEWLIERGGDGAARRGYDLAVAALRDDERYRNWWSPSGNQPTGAIRGHLADYLETVRDIEGGA